MQVINIKNNIIISELEEHYNLLRTNIQLCGSELKTILVTSNIKSEGKSIVSINLAYSFAKIGFKVLYIDADLRKSVFSSRVMSGEKIVGFSECLSGISSLKSIVYDTELNNLKVIPAGMISPRPTELLQSKRFNMIMDQFESIYDYIIIDSSPIGLVPDSLILSRRCDASILVVKSGAIKRSQLKQVTKQLQNNTNFLGYVLNMLDVKKSKYGNYGRYGNYGNYGNY